MSFRIPFIVLTGVVASAAGAFIASPTRAAEPAVAAPGAAALLAPDGAAIALSPTTEPRATTNATVAQSYGSNGAPIYEQATGWYVGLGLGAAWPSETGFRTRNLDNLGFENVNGDLSFGGGFSGDLAVGYDFGAIRTELSYVYTRSSVNEVSFSEQREQLRPQFLRHHQQERCLRQCLLGHQYRQPLDSLHRWRCWLYQPEHSPHQGLQMAVKASPPDMRTKVCLAGRPSWGSAMASVTSVTSTLKVRTPALPASMATTSATTPTTISAPSWASATASDSRLPSRWW